MAKSKKLSDFRQQAMNVNKHTERGMKALEASMNEVGYTAPMIAAADGEIIAGSARHETAANVFGADVEPVIIESDGKRPIVVVRTDIKNAETRAAKRIGLLDNRVQEIDLSFDPLVLAQLYAEDKTLTAGLWSDDELTELLNEAAGVAAGDADAEPQIDKAAELNKVWQVKAGDLWQIGAHRLLCGDSTKREDVERVMMGSDSFFCFTDPPYEMPHQNVLSAIAGFKNVLLMSSVRQCVGVMNSIKLDFKFDLVWNQHNPSSMFNKKVPYYLHKNIFYFGEAGATIFNCDNAKGQFSEKGYYPSIIDAPKNTSEIHVLSKNLNALVKMLSGFLFDVAFDPFVGSGTTLLACNNLGKKCFCVELNPDYCAVILQRMKDAIVGIEIKKISNAE
jgi:hypothetical protein